SSNAWPGRPRRQQRVVGDHGAAADEDRIHPPAELVDAAARFLTADPLRVATAGGKLAVEAHRPLEVDPRSAGAKEFQVGGVEPARLGFAQAHGDIQTGLPKNLNTAAVHPRE